MSIFRNILLLCVLSTLFSWVIYGIDRVFFTWYSQEEKYLEPTLPDNFTQIEEVGVSESIPEQDMQVAPVFEKPDVRALLEIYRQKAQEKKKQDKVVFEYIPEVFASEVSVYTQNTQDFLFQPFINQKIELLNIELYQSIIDVRGRMKNGVIQMFGVRDMSEEEFLSVLIHEFAHYLDIYYFSRDFGQDISTLFYDTSWESTTIIRPWQQQSDFVSGYSMTNKYEDFWESMTYYILHNKDFLEKSKDSVNLKKKYDFFWEYLFKNGEFIDTDFSPRNIVKSYYWDITKIEIDINNFLQYIKTII